MPNYALTGARWAQGSTVTWYYEGTSSAVTNRQISAGYPTTDLFPSEIRAAFSRWDDFANIRFQESSSASAANIVIRWGNIDGTLNILGQANYRYSQANGLFAPPVNITFDSSELYNPASGSERLAGTSASFYALALHEIGHAIGIAHYSGEQAIMNPYISSLNDMTLSDVAAVRALYGEAIPPYDIDWDLNWRLVSVGDFNRDGITDLVWQNTAGVLGGWVMSNNNRAATLNLPNSDWTAIGTGDFNGDGTSDIFWQNSQGLVGEWFMGGGTRQGTANIQNMPGWRVLGTGDFNGDGTSDIIWSNGAGVLGSWLMHDGQIAGTLTLPFFDWNLVAMGDFNRDGITDFLWQNSNGGVGEWLMADGTQAATFDLGSMAGWTPLGSGDFNRDGTDDVLWRDANGVTQVWLMNAAQIADRHGAGYVGGWQFRAIGDFNGDGYDDILWQDPSSGDLTIWNMGSGGVVVSMTAAPSSENAVSTNLGDDTFLFHSHAITSIADYVQHDDHVDGTDAPQDLAGDLGFDMLQYMLQRDALHFVDTSLA